MKKPLRLTKGLWVFGKQAARILLDQIKTRSCMPSHFLSPSNLSAGFGAPSSPN